MAANVSDQSTGVYDPRFEHDACGFGAIADIGGVPSHEVVTMALNALCNLDHRGAQGAEPDTGDGAGILLQMPHDYFQTVTSMDLPQAGNYASGLVFMPSN